MSLLITVQDIKIDPTGEKSELDTNESVFSSIFFLSTCEGVKQSIQLACLRLISVS